MGNQGPFKGRFFAWIRLPSCWKSVIEHIASIGFPGGFSGSRSKNPSPESNQGPAPKPHWWQRKEIIIAFAIIGTLVLIALLIFTAHTYHWDLTTTTTTEVTQSPQTKVTTIETGKTLWDWLSLLIQLLGTLAVPVVLGVGTLVFTRRQAQISEDNRKQQHNTEMQIAENQQQEELLRTYFDKLSELLLDKKLSTSPNIQSIVRARTLAALHILNTERKAIVLWFLHDAGLLQYVKNFLYELDLSNTDLNRINLSKANLSKANLSLAHLSEANLDGAELSGAELSGADLRGANLSKANLSKANLSFAHLSEADLDGAELSGADLRVADLSKANLSKADLSFAHLSKADLDGAELSGAALLDADLSGADLSEADLSEADLSLAKLWGADLSEADLRGARLWEADLRGADLNGAIATPEQFTEAKNVTPEQLAQLKPPKPAVPQEAKPEQASTTPSQIEPKPDQTSQEAE